MCCIYICCRALKTDSFKRFFGSKATTHRSPTEHFDRNKSRYVFKETKFLKNEKLKFLNYFWGFVWANRNVVKPIAFRVIYLTLETSKISVYLLNLFYFSSTVILKIVFHRPIRIFEIPSKVSNRTFYKSFFNSYQHKQCINSIQII